MKKTLRAPAVPLLTVDPYFSVWSMADRLYDTETCHWTGQPQSMYGALRIDGVDWRFMGERFTLRGADRRNRNSRQPMGMEQKSCRIEALTTEYVFTGGGVELAVTFLAPFLPELKEKMFRPVNYVTFRLRSIDGGTHRVELYFDLSAELCVNDGTEKVNFKSEKLAGRDLLSLGNRRQKPLNRSGDDLRIDWGRVYLLVPENGRAVRGDAAKVRVDFKSSPFAGTAVAESEPVIGFVQAFDVTPEIQEMTALAAYDDIYSIEYFHEKLVGAWRKLEPDFHAMLANAAKDYAELARRAVEFNAELAAEAEAAGGSDYRDICVLAYRQAFAAHKAVYDLQGKLLFLSKENFSNGCIGTVDVSYPSMPLFLRYWPELVKGMMRQIFRYAASDAWEYDFAPHDVGRYPLANGQVYKDNRREYQMPVEECGNMLLMAAAVAKAEGSAAFAREHWTLLKTWADYLDGIGLELGTQLCTDDFAGHLANNANLAIKGVLGIAAAGDLARQLGKRAAAKKYTARAAELAKAWRKKAAAGDHYVLAFGKPETWSMKYNLVWDKMLGYDLFDPEIARTEIAWYLRIQSEFGLALDNRKPYTKSDWIVWSATLAETRGDFEALIAPLWKFLDESPSRVPFTDWYGVNDRLVQAFQARSVVGGVFIKLLKDYWAK